MARDRAIATVVAAAALVVFCIVPLTMMLAVAGTTGIDVLRLFGDRERALLANSVALASATAALSTVIGVPLGLLLARGRIAWRGVLRLALAIPLAIPPYVMGLAWIYVGGSAGWMATLAGYDLLSTWTFSFTGAVIVLSLVYYAIPMLATEAALDRIAARLEEAGLVAASPRSTFARITVPLVLPAISAGALLVFVLALAEFGVPGLLRVRVYATEVLTAFATLYDFARASALALPLLAVAAVAALFVAALTGERLLTPRRGSGGVGIVLPAESRVVFFIWAMAMLLIASAAPILTLGAEAWTARTGSTVLAGSATAVANSLGIAAMAATIGVCCAAVLGYVRTRTDTPLLRSLDAFFVVLFAVPGPVVGVGLIATWNRDALGSFVYNSPAMLVFACLARFLPVAALVMGVAVRHVPPAQEEAAAVAGASWNRTFRQIVLPQMKGWLASVWVVVFVLSFGELGASVLVVPPGFDTLPVRTYTMVANAPSSQVAALALLQIGVIVGSLTCLAVISGKRRS